MVVVLLESWKQDTFVTVEIIGERISAMKFVEMALTLASMIVMMEILLMVMAVMPLV